MESALYMDDSYLKEFEAVVESIKDEKFVVLDKTAFYPQGGGQPYDTGVLIKDSEEYPVVSVRKADGLISHEVSKPGLTEGDKITGKINWERRYRFMKMHTAAHLLSAVMHSQDKVLITGNQIDLDKTRVDYNMAEFDQKKIKQYIEKVNQVIKQDLPVKVSYMDREEAMKIPGVVKLAGALPPDAHTLRIVEIPGVDLQADGGTHVKSLAEIGTVEFVKAENKGKDNRRVYYTVK
ncbi:alanyl-tRNA editing protein [Candidatus Woesearchaeota archaeon]|nr:alanyl-tRNA editing protein [Candidatus Woesearchaeota archaeon]